MENKKIYKSCKFNFREAKSCDSSNLYIVGYASVFNKVDYHGDVILPGAFSKSLQKLPEMYHEHQLPLVGGSWTRCEEDRFGLFVEGKISLNSVNEEVFELIKRQKLDELSVGFYLEKSHIENNVRVISKGNLVEISLVKQGANSKTYFSLENENQRNINSHHAYG